MRLAEWLRREETAVAIMLLALLAFIIGPRPLASYLFDDVSVSSVRSAKIIVLGALIAILAPYAWWRGDLRK